MRGAISSVLLHYIHYTRNTCIDGQDKSRLECIHCLCRDNSITQPVPVLANPIAEFKLTNIKHLPGLPGLPGSIRRLNCHGWPSAGEKSLKRINTPSRSPKDGQASPCLNSHFTHIPILIARSILCLVLPHHCPINAPQSIDYRSLLLFPASLGTCFSLSFSIQS